MLNYGEELAYWYLRLNGFFIISNFVLHREQDKEHRGDVDLLAIRLPNVKESIWVNGEAKEVPKDEDLFKYIDENKIVGIVAEVKAGLDGYSGDLKIFSDKSRLRKALERLGMYEEGLENKNWYEYKKDVGNYQILKILFINRGRKIKIKKIKNNGECLIVPLKHAEKFIRDRLEEYKEEKSGSWNFFPSEMIQYMIWTIKVKRTVRKRNRNQ